MNYKLINGDAIEYLKSIPDESIDLIVTDPPYKTISGGKVRDRSLSGYGHSVLYRNDGKIFDYNDVDHGEWIRESFRVLKDNTHMYIMTNTLNLFKFQKLAIEAGFQLHNLLVWKKNTTNANRWYMKNAEYILFLRKGRAKNINNMSSQTVHEYNNIVGNKKHPTEKPVDLMELYVSNSSAEGETVLDPFMGAGSTGIAAVNLNRKFIGIEIDETYFNITKERFSEEYENQKNIIPKNSESGEK